MAEEQQEHTEHLREPWLIAVWPGMGNVALGAGGYLIKQLNARLATELPSRGLFEIRQIEVEKGLATTGRTPRNMIFEWKDPTAKHDLIIFVGEAQPSTGGYDLCHKIIDYATQRGVRRVFTFAAMATQLHPTDEPRVFAAATDHDTLQELRPHEVEILEEGQISGLNGVLLAAGAERGLSGACLLGELPFFAAGVPNPKASKVVLDVFTRLAGIDIDFTELDQQAEAVQEGLLELLQQMREASKSGEEEFDVPEFAKTDDDDEEADEGDSSNGPGKEPQIDEPTRRRIETMFNEAQNDRSKAFQLKEELDRLGVFEQYEDRFLDLFKKAE